MPPRSGGAIARLIALLLLFWPFAGTAADLAPAAAPLAGFKHDRWPLEQGAPGRINAIGQSRDGFLWIGSVEGLFRFDGIDFERIDFAAPAAVRTVVSQVMGTRRGELWVGLARGRGVAIVRGGRLVDAGMPNPSREVTDIEEDADGAIWIARGGRSLDTLARYAGGRWQEFGTDAGLPVQPLWDLLSARDGTLWVVANDRLLRRRPGSARFEEANVRVAPRASIAEDARGRIWLSDSDGTRIIVAAPGSDAPIAAERFAHRDKVGGTRLLFDRAGDLWETTWNSGVLRVRAPDTPGALARVASFDATNSLTSDQTHALFQDREDNIWIGTELGLDRLRPARVQVESAIPANSPTSYRMASTRDGKVYVADASGVYMIAPRARPVRVLSLQTPAEALCADWDSGVWLISMDRVFRLRGDRADRYAKPAGVRALGCAHDAGGRLWLPGLDAGLFWMEGGAWRRWPGLSAGVGLPANAAVDPQGRAVILFRAPPPRWRDPPFLALSEKLSRVGGVEGLMSTAASGVLISGSSGLAAPFDRGAQPLAASSYPWAASLNGLVETARGDSWAIGDEGIIRLRTADLRRALRQPGRPVGYRRFDFRDGLNSFVQKAPGAQVAEGGDGRIWFLTRRNVVRIDPAALAINRLAPHVVITSLRAGGQLYDAASPFMLPAGTTGVELAFTATSLTVPDRVQFRYRLRGRDAGWKDAGGRRRASFGDLAPGSYDFQVIAANEDGVWNSEGRSLRFSIPKLFYQTLWFRLIAGVALLIVGYAAYVARVNYLGALLHDRLAERTLERERIARELHDTLIQAIQGLMMRFQSVADRLAGDAAAQAVLVPALDRAEEILVEGRDRLKGLRRLDNRHLGGELDRVAKEQAADGAARIYVSSNGASRPLASEVVDDVVGIIAEAVANAARHAQASEIEIHVDYRRRGVALLVRDDGAGIAPDIVATGGPAGHYGLLGMRERARKIGAKFAIESGRGLGTLIHLWVPGRVAYAHRRRPGSPPR